MLDVVLFLGFWVVLALAVFLVALRGGVGGARAAVQSQASSGRNALVLVFVIGYLGCGVAVPLLILTGNHSHASAQIGGIKLTAGEKQGRELFGEHCGVCHTLAAASTAGKVGPNLDLLSSSLSVGLVEHTINNGCLQNAPSGSPQACLGYGTMPQGVLQGKKADEVAEFVAQVAGKE